MEWLAQAQLAANLEAMRKARPEAYAFAPPSWILPDHYTEFLLACKVASS